MKQTNEIELTEVKTSEDVRIFFKIDDLRHDGVVFAEVELVANADFPCRLYQHIPEAKLLVELAQEEHLDVRPRLLLIAEEACGKHLRVVEDEHIVFVEVVQEVDEVAVLYLAAVAVKHEQAAVVAVRSGIFCNMVFGKVELEL